MIEVRRLRATDWARALRASATHVLRIATARPVPTSGSRPLTSVQSHIEMDRELFEEAKLARENAIAPFSRFRVGAALRTREGRTYRGCNVENASFGLTVCAERVALLTALAAGDREFAEIAVATQSDVPSTPCGPCRQLMWEYCGNIDVHVVSTTTGAQKSYRLSDLFPQPFELSPEE